MSNSLTLQLIDPAGVFWGAFFGLLLSLPIALSMTFWMSSVRNKAAVVAGAFVGGVIAFLVILGWAGTLIYDTPLPGAGGGPAFFGGLLFCAAAELLLGIFSDLLVARVNRRDYRRQAAPAHK